jgi:hypothetical protein
MTHVKSVKATTTPATLGQEIDVEITSLHNRVTALESKVKTDAEEALAWLKAQWPHFVTWAGVAFVALKGVL